MPLFSVIVPAYNRANLLPATLRSVIAQRFTDYEIVVVDDCSSDNTAQVVSEFGDRVTYVRRTENAGAPGPVRNDGLAVARGQYCAMLDSDDLWAPWTLDCFHDAIERFGRPAIVNCGGRVGIRDEMEMTGIVEEEPFSARVFEDYLHYRSRSARDLLLLTGMAIRTDILRSIGGFREKFRNFCEDQDLWLRLGTKRGFVRVARPLCWGYRDHPSNISKTFEHQLQGVGVLIEAERRGEYPGGRVRRRERHQVISATVRYVAREALRRGHVSAGWALYALALLWNMRLGRWRFVAAYPAMATAALLRRRKQRPGSAAAVT